MGKMLKTFLEAHFFMKKWEQLQLILDNLKSEVEQGDYQDKTQKFFKAMRV